MAISEFTAWEVRTTGADTNGGGFAFFGPTFEGTDRSQQDTPFNAGTDLIVNATDNTRVKSILHPVIYHDDMNNLVQIQGGGGWTAGFYQILNATYTEDGGITYWWTLDRSPAAVSTTGGTYAMGGCFATPGMAGFAKIACNDVWVKSGIYTFTTSTINISNGPPQEVFGVGGGNQNNFAKWRGYQNTRGDLGTAPVFKAGIDNIDLFAIGAQYVICDNINVDGDNRTGTRGHYSGNFYNVFQNCTSFRCTTTGLLLDDRNNRIYNYRATQCNTSFPYGAITFGRSNNSDNCFGYNVQVDNNIGIGAFIGSGSITNLISVYNTTGIYGPSTGYTLVNPTISYNTADGIYLDGNQGFSTDIWNPIIEGNGGYGINTNGIIFDGLIIKNPAFFNNTSGNYTVSQLPSLTNPILGSGSFFVNAALDNFNLNDNIGAGKLIKGLRYNYPDGLTSDYFDIGAAQSQVITGDINVTLTIH